LKPETVQFSQESLLVLNFALSFIMFGIALGMNKSDFVKARQFPKPLSVGLLSQFILLPFLTFLLIKTINPSYSIALGMILVAACPGGNMSNYITYLSKGNILLSIGLTASATIISLFMTPLNFSFYTGLLTIDKSSVDTEFSLSAMQMMKSVALLIVIPVIAGLLFKEYFPSLTKKTERPFKIISLIIFFGFILVALVNNFNVLKQQSLYFLIIIIVHNAIAFAGGYFLSKLFLLNDTDSRTISIETGIQNSGLGLVLIFSYFKGNPDMALVAAGWGIWHIVAGYILSLFWRKSNI
jgi:bile acid:Na+ symporter, BASS family